MFRNLWQILRPSQRAAFLGVFFLKALASCRFGSHFTHDLFIPFVDYFVSSHFQNPWAHFVQTVPDAFPYSGVMLTLLAVPRALLSPFMTPVSEVGVTWLHLLALRIPLLVADAVIFASLIAWFPGRVWRALLLYWCSPIVFYISYIHGQLDSIPTAILVLSIAAIMKERFLAAGLLYGAAISTKFHVLAIAPLLAIYLFKRSGRIRSPYPDALRFIAGTLVPMALTILPFAWDPNFQRMVFSEGESRAVFAYFIQVNPLVTFYICPAAVVAILVKFSTYEKANRDILILYCGLIFSSLVLLLPPAPGWYFWSIPFLVYFFVRQMDVSLLSYTVLSAAYLGYYLLIDWSKASGQAEEFRSLTSLAFTVLQTILAFVIFWIYKTGVKSNEEYKAIRKCLMIGIGGDSSTGKHTLAHSIQMLVSKQNMTQVNGDDYHKWPRDHESWKTATHLNPRGNDLHLPIEHMRRLKRGHQIRKRSYDHKTGQFTVPQEVDPKNFILYVGLHPFYLPRMREALDLKIFMETDERLRVAWKVARDSKKRGYTEDQVINQIEKRKPDSGQYIQPQKNFADLVIRYLPNDIVKQEPIPEFMAQYTLQSDVFLEPIIERLDRIKSLHVNWNYLTDLQRQEINIAGFISRTEISEIAYEVYPNVEEILMNRPIWEDDIRGINQLMTIAALSDRLEI